tara:strand:+ start:525 stop:983 length:459 start_codon:yes stop_codon:yes gene_type:complete
MSDFNLDNNEISLKTISNKSEKIIKISLNDTQLANFIKAVKELINSLQLNNCDWKANDNFLLMNVIQYGLVFTKKLKKMKTDKKKQLVLSLMLNILDTEVKKNEELIELKEKIVEGIETVVEPAIELAMLTQNNEFKIPKNFMLNLLKICKK